MEEFNVKITDSKGVIIVEGYSDQQYIGQAILARKDARANLASIEIMDQTSLRFGWLPFFKVRKNYRAQGFGNLLLQATIDYCASHGINHMYGKARGDMDILSPFCQRNGFAIDADNNISIDLECAR